MNDNNVPTTATAEELAAHVKNLDADKQTAPNKCKVEEGLAKMTAAVSSDVGVEEVLVETPVVH